MAYSAAGQVEASLNASAQSLINAPNFTPAAGETLLMCVWVADNISTLDSSITISDTTGSNGSSWTRITNAALQSGVGTWEWYYHKGTDTTNTSTTIRISFSSTKDFPAVYISRWTGLHATAPLGASTDVFAGSQFSPGTGTDAITSGNTSTLTGQPALVFGFAYQTSGVATPTAGTGFTSLTGVWDFAASQAVSVRPEHKRVTATTAVAATATSATVTANYQTAVIVLQESSGGSTFNVDVAEVITVVETVASTAVFTGSLADVLTVAETTTGRGIFTGSLAEVLTVLETVNSSAVMNVIRAEILTAVETTTGVIAGSGGNTVQIYSGVSALPEGGVTKVGVKLTPLGGNQYTVEYVSTVSENKIDSVHKEWYNIT